MGMNHDFWLFRKGERSYTTYRDLLSQHDAPVSIHDEVLRYFLDTLQWIPSFNPTRNEHMHGLCMWGVTIIEQRGGEMFQRIFSSWAQLLRCGPERLHLQGLYGWEWPFEADEHLVRVDELQKIGRYERLEIARDELVSQLTLLADFGEKAAAGEYFILHLGV